MLLLSNITAAKAKENYNNYYKNLTHNKFAFLQSCLERIEKFSQEGYNSIYTMQFYINQKSQIVSYANEAGSLVPMNDIPLSEITDFFKERGFEIDLKSMGYDSYHFYISW